MGHTKKSQQGFTLVELLVYIAILGMVTAALINFILAVNKSKAKQEVTQEVQANGRIAIDQISKKIRNSTGITTSTSNYGVDPGTLQITVASSTLSPTVIGLDRDNGRLQITEGSNDPVFITSDQVNITNFLLTDVTGPSSTKQTVQINMTISYDQFANGTEYTYAQDFQTTITTRN